LIAEAHDGSMFNGAADMRSLLRAAWSRSSSAEELLALELGEALIPPPLRSVLLDTAGIRPVSLVLSGDLGELAPVPLLAFGADRFARPLRLVEAAVLRLAPPAILVDRAPRRQSVTPLRYPILLACVDPTGDLANSREIPAGARVALSGAPGAAEPRANLANLLATLSSIRPGDAGLLYYSGHASTANFSNSDDALPLSDGDFLSARALFQAQQRVAFPARIMLSACRSGGITGGGAGEWLGLTAAALWLGCRQAVATSWPIWDTPFTGQFEQALAEALVEARDAAAALREVQLRALRDWRTSEHNLASWDKNALPYDGRLIPFPLIWAAYCCIGLSELG
jgi:hypothetical protein